MDQTRKLALSCLKRLVKPAVRFCLRYSLHIQDLMEAAKVAMVEYAEADIRGRERKVNVSRLSAATGLHRREIDRIFKHRQVIEEPRGLVNRVIGQWLEDRRYCIKPGKPKVLGLKGENSQFKRLVRTISKDMNPGSVLFELERSGLVERVKEGLKLTAASYIPRGNIEEGLSIIADDAIDMMACVEENLFEPKEIPNLHGRTEFDNVSAQNIDQIRRWLIQEGSALHRKARSFLSKFDKDINPLLDNKKEGVRVVLGTFSLVDKDGKELG